MDSFTRLVPDRNAMAPAAAVGILALAIALWLITRPAATPPAGRFRALLATNRTRIAGALAGIAIALGLLKIIVVALRLPTAFDRLGFSELHTAVATGTPTQMSGATALGFVLLGLAIWRAGQKRLAAVHLVFALTAGVIGWFAFTSYIYGGAALLPHPDMAIHTTISLLALSIGTLLARDDSGLMALLTSEHDGGIMARWLLVPALVVPVMVEWLQLKGQRMGWYGAEDGLALFAIANVLLFGALVWSTARIVGRADINRREMAEAFRKSEARLRTVIENISEGLVISDLHGQLLHWNHAALVMHDFENLDECRLRLPEFARLFELSSLNGAILPLEQWPLACIIRGEPVKDFEARLRRLDLEWEKIVSYGGGLVQEPTGATIAFVTITDITDRKRAESALRESEERYRRMIDEARDAVFTVNADQSISSLNPAFETITGFKRSDWLGRTFSMLVEPAEVPATTDRFERALRGERLPPFELRIRRGNGGYATLELTSSPLGVNGAAKGLMGIGRDVTDRKQLEAQYRQAQKMESLGTLAGGIAHDFNNILAAIHGYTELAKLTVHDATVREYLHAVCEAAARATDLVKRILAFSRQQPPQRTCVQLRQVVAESLKLLRASIPSTIEFDANLSRATAPVLADPSQVHQVIMNLGTNAWHAMKDRPGRLAVTLEDVEVDAYMAATNPSLKPGPYVRVSVSDTGCGMDRGTLERIFEPFFTTKPPAEGTGLGLSVVHGIMHSHDGAVTVYSEPRRGTTFQLYFPARPGEAAAPAATATTIPRGRGERVLFVDDEDLLANMGEIMLGQLGYAAMSSAKPADALRRVRADPAGFDLVITDFTMPGMTGVDLAEAIHGIRPDLPIILITGYTLGLTLERLRPIGIRELLSKPQTIEALAVAIRNALANDTRA